MHYTHALLTYVMKVMIALCPENFCASKSADLKVLTFWTFDWRTLQHQLQQLFWSHLSPTFHEWHPFDNHLYFIFIIIIVVHVYHSEYHPNLLQLQYHSILTSNTITPSLSSLSMIQAGELPDNFARWASNEFFIPWCQLSVHQHHLHQHQNHQ